MSDTVLKKSFIGGFKKKDVIDYIEQLQNDNSTLSEELSENAGAKEQVQTLSASNDALSARIESITAENASLKDDNDKLIKQNAALALEKEKLEAEKEALLKEIADIEERFAETSMKLEKANDTGSNSLVHNAINYSDKLIETARNAADELLGNAGNSVEVSVSQVTAAAEKIKTTKFSLNCSLDAVKDNLDSLSENLNNLLAEFKTGE